MKQEMDQQTFDIINKIANGHCFKTFGYLDQDDLKNEIWLICLSRLKEFDKDRGDLEHFLRVAVHNRMINKFKDITKSVRSPCPRCEFHDPNPSDGINCVKFGCEKDLCSKWKNYKLSIESRNSLLNTTEPVVEREHHSDGFKKCLGNELKEIITTNLDKKYIRDFEEFYSGSKLSKQKMNRLKKEIFQILKNLELDEYLSELVIEE